MRQRIQLLVLLISMCGVVNLRAQQNEIDSLETLLNICKTDTEKVLVLNALGRNLINNSNFEKGLKRVNEALVLSKNLNYKKGEAYALNHIGFANFRQGDYPKALEYYKQSLKIRDETGDQKGIAGSCNNIGQVYDEQGNYPKALEYYLKSLKVAENINDTIGIARALDNIGLSYRNQKDISMASDFYLKALKIREEMGDKNGVATSLNNIGVMYDDQGNYVEALKYHFQSLKISKEIGDKNRIAGCLNDIGSVYSNEENYPMAFKYYLNALIIRESTGDKSGMAQSLNNIGGVFWNQNKYPKALEYYFKAANIYEGIGNKKEKAGTFQNISIVYESQSNYSRALEYYKLYTEIKDTLFSEESERTLAEMKTKYKSEETAKENKLLSSENALQIAQVQKQRVIKKGFIGGFVLTLLLALVFINRFQIKKKSNHELAVAFTKLKSAQAQLIHSEKMASLGQLTAGVAHEINNPINFVSANITPLKRDIDGVMSLLEKYDSVDTGNYQNKLAEISVLKNEMDLPYTIKEIKSLISGIEEGSKRTAEIVKGLRNFSRLDEEEMKKVNIHEGISSTILLLHNKLKQKNLQVTESFGDLPQVECYPGQLNQVFMNILSNAIDAIGDKGEIIITTSVARDLQNHVIISIRDTGSGMSQETMKKIFDPFFTTKDVGKGTGLGLSISYGIIEKHKGKIEVKSDVGKGTEFIITLPLS